MMYLRLVSSLITNAAQPVTINVLRTKSVAHGRCHKKGLAED